MLPDQSGCTQAVTQSQQIQLSLLLQQPGFIDVNNTGSARKVISRQEKKEEKKKETSTRLKIKPPISTQSEETSVSVHCFIKTDSEKSQHKGKSCLREREVNFLPPRSHTRLHPRTECSWRRGEVLGQADISWSNRGWLWRWWQLTSSSSLIFQLWPLVNGVSSTGRQL